MNLSLNSVHLRPFGRRDLDFLVRARNDLTLEGPSQPTDPRPTTYSRYEANLNSGISAVSSGNPEDIEFAITRADDSCKAIIGIAGLYAIDRRHRLAELGVTIADPSARGLGIGIDTYCALARYAIFDLEIHKLVGHIKGSNEAALGTMQRVGFSPEGVLKEHRFENGRRVDLHVFRLLASEWDDGLLNWRGRA